MAPNPETYSDIIASPWGLPLLILLIGEGATSWCRVVLPFRYLFHAIEYCGQVWRRKWWRWNYALSGTNYGIVRYRGHGQHFWNGSLPSLLVVLGQFLDVGECSSWDVDQIFTATLAILSGKRQWRQLTRRPHVFHSWGLGNVGFLAIWFSISGLIAPFLF